MGRVVQELITLTWNDAFTTDVDVYGWFSPTQDIASETPKKVSRTHKKSGLTVSKLRYLLLERTMYANFRNYIHFIGSSL